MVKQQNYEYVKNHYLSYRFDMKKICHEFNKTAQFSERIGVSVGNN